MPSNTIHKHKHAVSPLVHRLVTPGSQGYAQPCWLRMYLEPHLSRISRDGVVKLVCDVPMRPDVATSRLGFRRVTDKFLEKLACMRQIQWRSKDMRTILHRLRHLTQKLNPGATEAQLDGYVRNRNPKAFQSCLLDDNVFWVEGVVDSMDKKECANQIERNNSKTAGHEFMKELAPQVYLDAPAVQTEEAGGEHRPTAIQQKTQERQDTALRFGCRGQAILANAA